jgi:hypothetical protein
LFYLVKSAKKLEIPFSRVQVNCTFTYVNIELPGGFYTGTVLEKDIFYLGYTSVTPPTGDITQAPDGLRFCNYVSICLISVVDRHVREGGLSYLLLN